MTQLKDCDRCSTAITVDNLGAVLCDDAVGLKRHGDVTLCDGCRDKFEDWLESPEP